MSTFLELRNEVTDLLIDAPTRTTGYVGALVNEAIKRLQVRHDFRVMRDTHTANTTAATHIVGLLPSNWKAARKRAWYKTQLGDHSPIEWLGDDDEEIFLHYSPDDTTDIGPPAHLFARSIDADGRFQLEVYPFSDTLSDWTTAPVGEYRLVLPYWKFLDPLVGDADTNWFTLHAQRYIVETAVGLSFEKNWDETRATFHFEKAERIYLREPKRIDAAAAMGGRRALTPRADVHAPIQGSTNWRY